MIYFYRFLGAPRAQSKAGVAQTSRKRSGNISGEQANTITEVDAGVALLAALVSHPPPKSQGGKKRESAIDADLGPAQRKARRAPAIVILGSNARELLLLQEAESSRPFSARHGLKTKAWQRVADELAAHAEFQQYKSSISNTFGRNV